MLDFPTPQDMENLLKLEAETDQEHKASKEYSAEWWRTLKKLNRLRNERIRMEARLKEMSASPRERRIMLLCPLHCQPGEVLEAHITEFASDWLALCPRCIEQGKEIRAKTGLSFTQQEVQDVKIKAAKEPSR